MAYVGMAVGVLWMTVVVLVLAMCRASGRADRAREPVAAAATRPVGSVSSAPGGRLSRAPARAAGAGARRDGTPEIAVAAATGAHWYGR
jgi:hypothetical protein